MAESLYGSEGSIGSRSWGDSTTALLPPSRLSTSCPGSAAATIHHPGSTAGSKPTTAPASLFAGVFSVDTRKARQLKEEGQYITRSIALEKVTKTGTASLLAKEIHRLTKEGKKGYLRHDWLQSDCDSAIAVARAKFKLAETEHKSAVNDAKKAGCTQQSINKAKAMAAPPGLESGMAVAMNTYYQNARISTAASAEGGSRGGGENFEE
jgi:hypothetical protein